MTGSAHWLLRAAEAKQIADQLHDADAKRTMMLVASGYERFAAYYDALHSLKVPMEDR